MTAMPRRRLRGAHKSVSVCRCSWSNHEALLEEGNKVSKISLLVLFRSKVHDDDAVIQEITRRTAGDAMVEVTEGREPFPKLFVAEGVFYGPDEIRKYLAAYWPESPAISSDMLER